MKPVIKKKKKTLLDAKESKGTPRQGERSRETRPEKDRGRKMPRSNAQMVGPSWSPKNVKPTSCPDQNGRRWENAQETRTIYRPKGGSVGNSKVAINGRDFRAIMGGTRKVRVGGGAGGKKRPNRCGGGWEPWPGG